MFIVFGSPRSGTTLLASSLNQSDHLAVPDETDFIVPAAFIIDRVKDPARGRSLIAELIVAAERFEPSLGEYLTPEEVSASVAEADYTLPGLLQSIYGRVAKAAKRRMAGDKSPNDIAFARILLKNGLAESPIKVIHIVRDLRDVLLSLEEAQPWAWKDIAGYFPRLWSQSNLMLQDAYAGRHAKYLFVRYEDLVHKPTVELRRISSFLEIPYQKKILDPTGRAYRYVNQDHHRNLNRPIRQRRGNWRSTLTRELRARCQVEAREALERFDYPFE